VSYSRRNYPVLSRARRSRWHTFAAVVLGLLSPLPGFADQVTGNVGQLTELWTYSDYGAGDVVVSVQSPLPTCQHGFWLRMTDVGAKTVFAQLLAAFHTKTSLRVYAYDDQIWAGSSGRYCRIYTLTPVS
jgi:hypothetical protein